MVIKESFIKLLTEKDLKKITVREICEEADINRATFYRYYLDVYDLLEQIQNEFVQEIKDACDKENEYSVVTFSKELITAFLKNKELAKVLFNTNNNIYFLNDIMDLAYEKCRAKWLKDIPSLEDEKIEYASSFIFNGALGVVNYWVQNDFDKSVDEVSQMIETLSYYGTKEFIYKN